METIVFNKSKYVSADNIIENAPIYCKGVRNGRELTKKKDIKDKYFIYARLIDGVWEENEGKSVKYDKVFIKKSYSDKIEILVNELKNEDVKDEKGIEKAPEIIDLKDSEKFQDSDGNVLEIETRGKREYDKIFFKVKDVESGFKMITLYKNLIKENTLYEKNKDYIYFNCKKVHSVSNKTSKNEITKELFLTYTGMLRVLFVSRSGDAGKFIKWATEKLFTLQMGTEKQKKKLVADVLGVDANAITEVFNKDANALPCVYFFTLGYVKNLRESMAISNDYSDNEIVGIYGFTKDLARRTGEHMSFFNKIKGCDLKLKWYSYIDQQYVSKAETDVRACMNSLDLHLVYKKEEEMVVFNDKQMKIIEMQYENISRKYIGHVSELMTRLKEADEKAEKVELVHKLELQKVQHEKEIQKEKYELMIEKSENSLLKKEIELMKLQSKKK